MDGRITGDPDNPDYQFECKQSTDCGNLPKCASNNTEGGCGCKELTCEKECVRETCGSFDPVNLWCLCCVDTNRV